MYQVKELSPVGHYLDLELRANGRLLKSFRVRFPSIGAQASSMLAIDRSGYAGSIKGAINWQSMPLIPDVADQRVWYHTRLPIPEGGEMIGCLWGQKVGDSSWFVLLTLQYGDEWPMENPPRDPRRIGFVEGVLTDGLTLYDRLEAPDVVARDSLAALPYVGIPTWGWAVLGAVGIVGTVALVKAAR